MTQNAPPHVCRTTRLLAAAFVFFILAAPARAVSYIPVTTGLLSTGQWYFEGEKSSLGGNAAINFVPALKFSSRFSLIPTIDSSYRGTRSAEELAGGKNLFQDTWENGLGVTALHSLSESWKLRERAGVRSKWFRETRDENWNQGLYDYRVYTVGGEVEHDWSKDLTLAGGYDFSYLEFPNYVSLESQQTADSSREFAGANVLDTRMHTLSLRLASPFLWQSHTDLQAYYSPREYVSQHVVELNGLFSSTERKDLYTGGTLGLERDFKTPFNTRLMSRLSYGYSTFDSNQNHYDARLTTFIANFYDYIEQTGGLQLTLAFGKARSAGPMLFDAGYSLTRRNYNERLIQNVAGNYLNDKLYITESFLTLGYSYPLSRNIRLRAMSSFGRSRSNNDYEAVYRYNYATATYQFGFSFDY